jgi:hypothetical protein
MDWPERSKPAANTEADGSKLIKTAEYILLSFMVLSLMPFCN